MARDLQQILTWAHQQGKFEYPVIPSDTYTAKDTISRTRVRPALIQSPRWSRSDKGGLFGCQPVRVYWERSAEGGSFKHVTDEMLKRLDASSSVQLLTKEDLRHSESLTIDVYVRFVWPPNFRRPRECQRGTCQFVVWQPWEFGSVPINWDLLINRYVDEVWVPSAATAKMFFEGRSKTPPSKVTVIPHGVDCDTYTPCGTLMTDEEWKALGVEPGSKVLLWVGGLLGRKGVDVLLEAWKRVSKRGDVRKLKPLPTLLLKSNYNHGFDMVRCHTGRVGGWKVSRLITEMASVSLCAGDSRSSRTR